jgi:hypothetical protein
MAGQIEKETNLCVLSGLCGETLYENGIGFHEVSYERRLWPRASSQIEKKKLHFCNKQCSFIIVAYRLSAYLTTDTRSASGGKPNMALRPSNCVSQ